MVRLLFFTDNFYLIQISLIREKYDDLISKNLKVQKQKIQNMRAVILEG